MGPRYSVGAGKCLECALWVGVVGSSTAKVYWLAPPQAQGSAASSSQQPVALVPRTFFPSEAALFCSFLSFHCHHLHLLRLPHCTPPTRSDTLDLTDLDLCYSIPYSLPSATTSVHLSSRLPCRHRFNCRYFEPQPPNIPIHSSHSATLTTIAFRQDCPRTARVASPLVCWSRLAAARGAGKRAQEEYQQPHSRS